jgi:hypothetical protein
VKERQESKKAKEKEKDGILSCGVLKCAERTLNGSSSRNLAVIPMTFSKS